jgi:replicative DNA helicase
MEGKPPYSQEAERAVLGCALLDAPGTLYLTETRGVTPDHFYVPAHRLVYEHITELSKKHTASFVDLVTVIDSLTKAGKLDAVGGQSEICRWAETTPTTAHASHYIGIVHEKYLTREGIRFCREMEQKLSSEEEEPISVMSDIVGRASAMTTTHARQESMTHDQAYATLREGWMRASETGTMGFPSRWIPVENILGSYVPPKSVVLAAHTSDGKTSLALAESTHVADELEEPVLWIGLEMEHQELWDRVVGSEAKVNTFKFRRGMFDASELERLDRAHKRLSNLPIHFVGGRMTIDEIETRIISMCSKYGIRFVVLDYIQIIQQRNYNDRRSRTEIVAEWSCRLCTLEKSLGIVILVLSQFNRRGHKDHTKTPPPPTLESLRESGAIEQDADIVILIYKRPGEDLQTVFNATPDQDWPMVVDIRKHRNGPTGAVPMYFIRKHQIWMPAKQYEYEQAAVAEANARHEHPEEPVTACKPMPWDQ